MTHAAQVATLRTIGSQTHPAIHQMLLSHDSQLQVCLPTHTLLIRLADADQSHMSCLCTFVAEANGPCSWYARVHVPRSKH